MYPGKKAYLTWSRVLERHHSNHNNVSKMHRVVKTLDKDENEEIDLLALWSELKLLNSSRAFRTVSGV